MLDPQKGIVGISIGPERIFVTQLRRTAGKLEIDKSVSVGIPTRAIQNGLIVDIKVFAQTLKKLFIDNDIKARQVIGSISDAAVIMQVAKLPKMPKTQMKEALKGEIDKYMLSGEEAVLDYYPLDKEKVFIVAIKKDIVKTLLTTMEKAGLDLVGIDIAPLAALRALGQGNIDLASKKATILILVGSEKTDISVIKDGIPSYSRSVDTADVPELTKEIKITTTYWEEEFPDVLIEKIVILGDTTKAKNLHVELPEELGAIEQGRPLGMIFADFNLSQSVSIGLAMRGTGEKFTFDTNLLPPEKFIKMKLEKRFLVSFASVSAILFAFFIMSFVFSIIINSYEKKLTPIKQELATSPDILTEVEKVNEERRYIINSLNQKEQFIAQIQLTPWPEILRDLKDYIPKEVQLTEISSKKDTTLILQGKSFSQDAVYKYVHLLAFSDYFYEPKLAVMEDEEEKDSSIFKFNIICPLIEEEKKE